MLPLLHMLELNNLSLRDAEAHGYPQLAAAARRCARCADRVACIRWLKWRGTDGRAPVCLNAYYFEELRGASRTRAAPRA